MHYTWDYWDLDFAHPLENRICVRHLAALERYTLIHSVTRSGGSQPFRLRKEADPSSEKLCSFRILGERRSAEKTSATELNAAVALERMDCELQPLHQSRALVKCTQRYSLSGSLRLLAFLLYIFSSHVSLISPIRQSVEFLVPVFVAFCST
jgi:hypothetical protein